MSERPALSRVLDLEEQRVLGTLIEKSLVTPEQYPLSVNATRIGCNQKTARDPVVEFDDRTTYSALGRLRAMDLVRELSPAESRVARYEHRLGMKLDLRNPAVVLLGVLLLRGPQTSGELRQHSHRMHEFHSVEAVDDVLERLINRDPPLVIRLPRAPWHSAPISGQTFTAAAAAPVWVEEVAALRAQITQLQQRVAALEEARAADRTQ
jgi:uncharacterized protein YceH (UPF0502 family)